MKRKLSQPYLVLLLFISSFTLSYGNYPQLDKGTYTIEPTINNFLASLSEEPPAANPGDFVIRRKADFNNHNVGRYSQGEFRADWNCCFLTNTNTAFIRNVDGRKVLSSYYPQGTWGGGYGLNEMVHLGDSPNNIEEAYMTYQLKFDDNFDWGLSNKLPGLVFGRHPNTASGGRGPNIRDMGSSIRMAWYSGGRLGLYVYHHAMSGQYGEQMGLGDLTTIRKGQWHEITLRVVANTIGQANGIIQIWVDGRLVGSVNNALLRTATSQQTIETIALATFMGGGDARFAAGRDQYMNIDNFYVWQYSQAYLASNPGVARGNRLHDANHNLYTPLSGNAPAPPANTPPTVSITSPGDNETFETGQAIEIAADAADADGDIAKVEFYNGNTLIGTATDEPFKITLGDLGEGKHTLTAKAFDDKGANTVSNAVTINVANTNSPPNVKLISPANNSEFGLLSILDIAAEASDDDGEITKVEFYIGNTLIETVTKEPFETKFNTLNLGLGTFVLTAVAYDDQGAKTTSDKISFSLFNTNSPPEVAIVTPDNNATFEEGTAFEISADASDAEGDVTKVEFYLNDKLVGTATAEPFKVTVDDLDPGTYALTAKAFDEAGASTVSGVVTITIEEQEAENTAPEVAIVTPDNNATFEEGTAFEISADASDAEGDVTKVEFYVNDKLVGTATDEPFKVTVDDLDPGTYALTAKAFDEAGASTVSGVVTITIEEQEAENTAPEVEIVTPDNNATFEEGIAFEISADASDVEGDVTKVEFYVNDKLVGTATDEPFKVTVNDLEPGTYALTAKAFDEAGASTVSGVVTITIEEQEAENTAPEVEIVTPNNNATFEEGTAFEISADASDAEGDVTKVEFYVNDKLVGTATAEPFKVTVDDLEPGTYALSAKAFDEAGASTVSEVVTVNIEEQEEEQAENIAPEVAVVTPEQNTDIELGTAFDITAEATDEDGEITKVEFFINGGLIATSTEAPYTVTVADLEVGTYTITAEAFDEEGASTVSEDVTVNVVEVEEDEEEEAENIAPEVAVVTPEQNANIELGTAFDITAEATDEDGEITKVEFFINGGLIATSTEAPYTVTVADLEVGTYTITAEAFDEEGASTVSEEVTINVVEVEEDETEEDESDEENNDDEDDENSDEDEEAENIAPEVAVVTPEQNTDIELGTAFEITAEASDEDGEITKVEFFINGGLIATATDAPYTVTVADLEVGTYTITAEAFDEEGASTVSEEVTINVVEVEEDETEEDESDEDQENDEDENDENTDEDEEEQEENIAPEVAVVTPEQNTDIELGAAFEITAEATDEDGEITKVEFFINGGLIATSTEAPYTVTVADLEVGTYTITAEAFDEEGASTVSEEVTINVVEVEADETEEDEDESDQENNEDEDDENSDEDEEEQEENIAPEVAVVTPEQNTNIELGTAFEITAEASDEDGEITKVEFFINGGLIATATDAPYTVTVADLEAGTYTITAEAFDEEGASTVSEEVTINVVEVEEDETEEDESDEDQENNEDENDENTDEDEEEQEENIAPEVAVVTPEQNANIELGTAFEITAEATDEDGEITKVEFFINGGLIATSTEAPYTVTVADLEVGTYTITAEAFDEEGASTVSEEITINVVEVEADETEEDEDESDEENNEDEDDENSDEDEEEQEENIAPKVEVVTPEQNANIELGTAFEITAEASDEDGEITKVEFFINGGLIATSTEAPYTVTVADLEVGTYTITAEAFDEEGASTVSEEITINVVEVEADETEEDEDESDEENNEDEDDENSDEDEEEQEENIAPKVEVVTPEQNANIELGTAFEITAEASDEDGGITKVVLINGGLIATSTEAPFTVNVTDLEIGTYTITAEAFDEEGASTVSEEVTVNVLEVEEPWFVSLVSPEDEQQLEIGDDILLSGAIDGVEVELVEKVEFYNGDHLLGTATNSPFEFVFENAEEGTYVFTAVAYKEAGNVTSEVITVTVGSGIPNFTVVLVSPEQDATFEMDEVIEGFVEITDTEEEIVSVVIYLNGELFETIETAPFAFSISDLVAGTYELEAIAYTQKGVFSTSETVTIEVLSDNIAPEVEITSPSENETFEYGAAIEITADAIDTDGEVVKVEFFVDNRLIGTVTEAPYLVVTSDLEIGTYAITAKAFDENGATTVSEVVNIQVVEVELDEEADNIAPEVQIVTPTQNEFFDLGDPIAITAEATDADGEIVQVEFFKEKTLVGSLTEAPYTITLMDLEEGTHEFSVRAYDDAGDSRLSESVTIIISGPKNLPVVQLVSPKANEVISDQTSITLVAEAIVNEEELTKVEFFNGDFLLGTVTEGPYILTLEDLIDGTYTFTAVAYNAEDEFTVSAVVVVTVNNGNPLAIVKIINPEENATFEYGETVAVEASIEGGEILLVEFYSGNDMVGQTTENPYQVQLEDLATGTHELAAVAYDKDGVFAKSEVVTINVGEKRPPEVRIVAPGNNSEFFRYEEVEFETEVEAPDSKVAKIEYFQNNILIGRARDGANKFTWRAGTVGNLNIRAIVTDEEGMTATSAPIAIRVRNNNPPQIAIISPADESVYLHGNDIDFEVKANDTDGEVKLVEYYSNEILIGSVETAPFNFTWTQPALGRYGITAKAFDDRGASTISQVLFVNVESDESFETEEEGGAEFNAVVPDIMILNPVLKQEFDHNSDIDFMVMFQGSDESVQKVEYYIGDRIVGESTVSPFGFAWKNAPTGNHILVAKAMGKAGTIPTVSEAITFTVKAREVTRFEIVNPMHNAVFSEGSNIDIRVAFPDGGKAISHVDYFRGNVQIGSVSEEPYDFTWKKVIRGDYSLVARVVYLDGTHELSIPINISVVQRGMGLIRLVSPVDEMEVESGSNLPFEVEILAEDADVFTEVEYLINGKPIVALDDQPFGYIWKNIKSGTYTIEARGKDKTGRYHYSQDIEVTALDTDARELNSIRMEYTIGPNPTSDYLNVFFHNLERAYDFNVRVISMTGLVHQEFEIHVDGSEITLDMTDLRDGTYVLQFISNGKQVSSTRFIKR